MALWGNNDNVDSVGAVVLDYDTGVVTGTGTSFGQTGSAQEGDVLRFGTKATTYFGDAVIVSVASTIQCTIGSTAGLSGAAIAGVQFGVSQLPKYTILDNTYSETRAENTSLLAIVNTSTSTIAVGGTTLIPVTSAEGIIVGDSLEGPTFSSTLISVVADTQLTLASAIGAGATVSAGAALTVSRAQGGYDAFVYGTNEVSTEAETGTQYELTHGGWVGVTTYTDNEGNLRVKKETLVAMSGITTGGTDYPTP
jgi:hypothetical protein